MVASLKSAPTGTVTESLTERSSLNLYEILRARECSLLEHVTCRLQSSDWYRAYVPKAAPGLAQRLALVVIAACGEAIAAGKADTATAIREAIETTEGRRPVRFPSNAGPGCEQCNHTGVQLNAEDRTVVPCCGCGTVLIERPAPSNARSNAEGKRYRIVRYHMGGKTGWYYTGSERGDHTWSKDDTRALIFPDKHAAQLVASTFHGAEVHTVMPPVGEALPAHEDTGHHDVQWSEGAS